MAPRTIDDLFGGPKGRVLLGKYHATKYERILEKRQRTAMKRVLEADLNGYKVPIGIKLAHRTPLLHNQKVHRWPWAVRWKGKDGEWRERKCETLIGAVLFHRKAVKVTKTATIISRCRGYDIPPELRNRIPKGWKWCPYCMKPKKYRRCTPEETFFALVKEWDPDKERYVPKERKLAVMRCPTCGNTNRDAIFRRSNQPWEIRKIKQGASRVKRRKHAKRIKRKR